MKNIKSLCILLLTAIIWGFAFVAQRKGAEHVGAFTFNGIRFALGALSLIPVIYLFEKKESTEKLHKRKLKKSGIVGIVAGTVLFIASWLQQYGIEITGSAGKAGFITGLYTVLVPVIYFLFFCRKTGLSVWIGAVAAVAGLYLLCGVDTSMPFGWGDVVLIIGAVLWALHIIILDHASDKVLPLRFSFVQFSVCAVLTLGCALMFEREAFAVGYVKSALIPLLYGGVGSVGIAYTCQLLGQRDADPTFAAIVLSTEAVFSAIGAAIILGEYMKPAGYIGCGLIFIGIILSQMPVGTKKE